MKWAAVPTTAEGFEAINESTVGALSDEQVLDFHWSALLGMVHRTTFLAPMLRMVKRAQRHMRLTLTTREAPKWRQKENRRMLLKVGELAKRTGLTIRTLHHYDELGLLKPSHRSDAGYRLYDRDDLARLHPRQD